jgi:hypothetical protein
MKDFKLLAGPCGAGKSAHGAGVQQHKALGKIKGLA